MAVKERLNDDLFSHSTMTFGEHLEELRVCLWRAVIGLGVGFLIGLYFAEDVVKLIQVPLTQALERFYEEQSLVRYRAEVAAAQERGIDVPYEASRVESFVEQEHMTFEPVYVESDDVLRQLRQSYPDAFVDDKVGPNPPFHPLSRNGPGTIVPRDFKDAAAMARALVAAGDGPSNSPARPFWAALDEGQQARVREIAKGSKKPAKSSESEVEAGTAEEKQGPTPAEELAAILNPLLAHPALYDEKTLAKAELTQEARKLVALATLEAGERRRLNRLLFEAAFPELVPRTHVELVRLNLWRPVGDNMRVRPTSLSAQEVFGIWMKAAFVVGALIAGPWVFLQIWAFVAAGLYPHEKQYVYIFLPFSIGLFLGGAALAALFVFEPVLDFFFSFNADLGIDPDPRISEWLGFVLILPLGFGVSFQLPLVMLFMERIGIFTVAAYMKNIRIAVLAIFVIAMVLTPAEPISMLLMAIPLCGLYVLGVALCKWLPRGRLFAPGD